MSLNNNYKQNAKFTVVSVYFLTNVRLLKLPIYKEDDKYLFKK